VPLPSSRGGAASPPPRRSGEGFSRSRKPVPKRARLGPLCLLTYDTAAARAPPAPCGSTSQPPNRGIVVPRDAFASARSRARCDASRHGREKFRTPSGRARQSPGSPPGYVSRKNEALPPPPPPPPSIVGRASAANRTMGARYAYTRRTISIATHVGVSAAINKAARRWLVSRRGWKSRNRY